jgi:hypothetical protein
MAAFDGTTYEVGTRVMIVDGGPETIATIQVVGSNGWYVVLEEGKDSGITMHHSRLTPLTFDGTRCSDCGEAFRMRQEGDLLMPDEEIAEVVNRTTGAHSVQHVSCFQAHDDCCYDLA